MLEIPLVCVVTDLDRVDYDVILPAAVVSELQAPAVSDVLSVGDASSVNPVTQTADFSGQVEPSEVDILNVDDIPEDNVEGDSTVLIAEQKADPSLASYWKAAEAGRSDVVIHRGILYHKDQVECQPVCQLCVPKGRSQRDETGPRFRLWGLPW